MNTPLIVYQCQLLTFVPSVRSATIQRGSVSPILAIYVVAWRNTTTINLTNSTTSTFLLLLPPNSEGFSSTDGVITLISKVRRKNQIPEIFLFPANFSHICARCSSQCDAYFPYRFGDSREQGSSLVPSKIGTTASNPSAQLLLAEGSDWISSVQVLKGGSIARTYSPSLQASQTTANKSTLQ